MNIKTIKSYYRKFVNPGFVDQIELFSFHKDIFIKSRGVIIYTRNKKFLDITGGLGVLNHGHNHPKIISARAKYNSNYNLEVHKNILSRHVALLAKMIASFFYNKLNFSYFCNSGAEANEAALKAAYRFHSGKRKTILISKIGFHGKLIATGSISSPLKNNNFPDVLKKVEYDPNNYEDLKKIQKKNKKKCDIFALIIEPFSASTTTPINENYLRQIKKFCNEKKIILIFDEIYTGWCKTGTTFYFQRFKNLYPDILTTSKSLGGGKASIAACVTSDRIFKKIYGKIEDSTLHSTTFNGFGEECITAIESIKILKKEKFNLKAQNIQNLITKNFKNLKNNNNDIKMKLKGCGAIQKIYFKLDEMTKSKVSKILSQKNNKNIKKFEKRIFEIAIIDTLYREFNIFAFHSLNSLVVSPSLIIKNNQINYVFKSLNKILKKGPENIVRSYIKNLKN